MFQRCTVTLRWAHLLGSAILGLALALFMLPASADAATKSATCFGQSLTLSANMPGSVTVGSAFAVTGISGSSNTLGQTVTANTVTFSVTNATPATFQKTWTGSANGTLTANFSNQTLTPTGAGAITLSVTQMATTINGLGTLTCKLSDSTLVGSSDLVSTTASAASSGGGTSATTPAATQKLGGATTTTAAASATTTTAVNSTTTAEGSSTTKKTTTTSATGTSEVNATPAGSNQALRLGIAAVVGLFVAVGVLFGYKNLIRK